MNIEEILKKEREECLKHFEELKTLRMPADYRNKINGFYKNNGKSVLENYKKESEKDSGVYINLYWDEKSGLTHLNIFPDMGVDLFGNEFVLHNIFNDTIKQPLLKIIKKYKLLLEQIS
ncbi:MAG: hypothetical protein AABW67_01595 [Nanoarchaeota archaeon]